MIRHRMSVGQALADRQNVGFGGRRAGFGRFATRRRLIVLRYTPVGRRLYAFGDKPSAAAQALVRGRAVWIGVYAVSAVCAAVAGILLGGLSSRRCSSVSA